MLPRGPDHGKAVGALGGIIISCFSWAPEVLLSPGFSSPSSCPLIQNVDLGERGGGGQR